MSTLIVSMCNAVATPMRRPWYLPLLIFTDRVHSTRESYVLTHVCPHLGGGGIPARCRQGGTPARSSRGYPWRGYTIWGTHVRPGRGSTPAGGYPTSGTSLIRSGRGGGGFPTSGGVLDTPWSVCLLHSRRTFLFIKNL